MLDFNRVNEILGSEMVYATGCTEPGAIAYAASAAKDQLEGPAERLTVRASGNVIKNAMAAGIPGTPYVGIEYAAAVGAVGGQTALKLKAISAVSVEQYRRAEELVSGGRVAVLAAHADEKLYIEAEAYDGLGNMGRAVIAGSHTNLTRVERNGAVVLLGGAGAAGPTVTPEAISREWSVCEILRFVDEMEPETQTPAIIRQAISVNTAISDLGLRQRYGMGVGPSIARGVERGSVGNDLASRASLRAAAGVDARMAGANAAVITNSGSGNQGITATMGVVGAAEYLGADRAALVRAVTFSNMMAVYIHAKFGRLSALCGATCAGMGVACGVVRLLGGGLEEVECALQTMIGDVTGMICDGGKPNCAVKVATCISSACRAALLGMEHIRPGSREGIIEQQVERTIQNFCTLGNEGTAEVDRVILRMMTGKPGPAPLPV